MSRNIKRWTAFLGMLGFTTALLCFTIMLAGENCPAFPIVEKTASSDLPPCHQKEKSTHDDETLPNCSSCHFEVSQESIQLKTPDLHPNGQNVLSAFSEVFFQELKPGKNLEFSFLEARSFNPQKFVLLSIASIRILT
ncbi:hypothetical protein JWG45_14885 [Leptospira sp. 201903070]|uniref:Uncharacterized protein n=1 Tax=Leptospira ainlahdjerensis TaxID=2810033 RepID=A0ABS2UDK1_9LEPT|nr:hypothetical protein [Leptospira ainlahdjerensis]MBM9578433.1 hypothetical protein [Leptospira ainlahdjerensis]